MQVVKYAWLTLIVDHALNDDLINYLTLAFQLFRIECRLRTLVDDKPLLHHLD